MNTTDLKPGDIVQHPEKGRGIVVSGPYGMTVICNHSSVTLGDLSWGHSDLTGWESAEIVRSGHVQVKVDDLDLSRWPTDEQPIDTDDALVVIRAAKAIVAQRAKRVYAAESRKKHSEATITVKIDKESIAQVVHDEIKKTIEEGRLYKVDND